MAQRLLKNIKGNIIVHANSEALELSNIFADYDYAAYVDGIDDTTGISFDFMLLPGGALDINPKLYNQQPHPTTNFHNDYDLREIAFYHKHKKLKKLGVCRGAQLLNVLNGGSMWQNVSGHQGGKHVIEDINGRQRVVSTVHHQMMRPGDKACIIAWTRKAQMKEDDKVTRTMPVPEEDPEVILYPEDRALCYQPHPEWDLNISRDYFFNLIEEFVH